MVVNHHSVHDSRFVVFALDTQHIAVDSVVESTGRNIDFLLRLSDILTQRINLIVRDRNKIVHSEKRQDTDDNRADYQRPQNPVQGNTCGLHGYKLIVLSHLTDSHDRGQQCS